MRISDQIAAVQRMNKSQLLDFVIANPHYLIDPFYKDLAEAIKLRRAEVIIRRQRRGLCVVSRSKRLDGVANAAPNSRGHLSVAGSAPQPLVQSHVFFLLVFDVFADHCCCLPGRAGGTVAVG